MKRPAQGKIIRVCVTIGVVFLHFAAAYVIGGVVQSLYSGSHNENYADIAAEPAPENASRGPASVQKKRVARPPAGNGTQAQEEGREVASTGEYAFEAGGEESGTFMENFFHYLGTGDWPEPGKKADSASTEEKKEPIYGIGRPLSGSLGATSSSGSSGDSGATNSSPTVNVMPPFFVSNPTGGINSVTGGGFKVMATGGAALSAVHGTTSSGYRIWFNQGGQASAQ